MRLHSLRRIALVLFILARLGANGATYFVAPIGNDTNAGTSAAPWKTIQFSANTTQPGDTVIVRSGTYPERVKTTRGGTSPEAPITFIAEGVVVMKGWWINNPFISIRGFEITGHSGASVSDAHVRVDAKGDFFRMNECTIRDGMQIVLPDVAFRAADKTIQSATGGFLAARFAPGQTLYVGMATDNVTLANRALVSTITSVTDNVIQVSDAVIDQDPVPAYLSASFVYGLQFHTDAEGAVIRNNRFQNLGYDSWAIFGRNHLIEENVIEKSNGWDAMHFGGSNHVFRLNLIHNSPLLVYQVSPDALENLSQAPYFNITFVSNIVSGFVGVLASQKSQNTMSGLYLYRNVFADVGRFVFTHPNTTVLNNTFVRVAKKGSPVHARAAHPINTNPIVGATNIIIANNIFVDCGEPSPSQSASTVGWYEINGDRSTIQTLGNFVAGAPPQFPSKSTWSETIPEFNGGDPGFVDINNVLGPDGLPFTSDDGLQLTAASKLIGKSSGGTTPGAYLPPSPPPTLGIAQDAGRTHITWPAIYTNWVLQVSPLDSIAWQPFPSTPVLLQDRWQVLISPTNRSEGFRLAR